VNLVLFKMLPQTILAGLQLSVLVITYKTFLVTAFGLGRFRDFTVAVGAADSWPACSHLSNTE
jgi:hypothetical protein